MFVQLIFLLAIFLGIPTLIRLDVLSVRYRLFLLFGIFIAMVIWGFTTLTPMAMGMTNINFMRGVLPWGAATLCMLVGIWVIASLLKHQHAEDPLRDPHFLFLFIPISIVQQFMYQSVLLQKLLHTGGNLIFITILSLSRFSARRGIPYGLKPCCGIF